MRSINEKHAASDIYPQAKPRPSNGRAKQKTIEDALREAEQQGQRLTYKDGLAAGLDKTNPIMLDEILSDELDERRDSLRPGYALVADLVPGERFVYGGRVHMRLDNSEAKCTVDTSGNIFNAQSWVNEADGPFTVVELLK